MLKAAETKATDIPGSTESNCTDLPRRTSKRKPKADHETIASIEPPKKRRRKKSAEPLAPIEHTPCPAPVDPAAVIEASGTDVSNWEVLHVPPLLLAGLAELRYEQPTEIQVSAD